MYKVHVQTKEEAFFYVYPHRVAPLFISPRCLSFQVHGSSCSASYFGQGRGEENITDFKPTSGNYAGYGLDLPPKN